MKQWKEGLQATPRDGDTFLNLEKGCLFLLTAESRGLENSGAKAAKSASRASNAHVILPLLTEKEVSEGFTDFADIAKRQGIGSVKKQIVNALASLDHSRELERAFTR